MKIITLAVCLATFASACSYSHVGIPSATFNRGTPPVGAAVDEAQSGALVLRISRHLDTVVRGPDPEEDQLLILTVRDFRPGQKLRIPSVNVTPEFTVTRFEPGSRGDTFVGYLIVRKVTPTKVDATLHLDVTARTASGSYTETAKFRGEYSFAYRVPETDSTP